MRAVRAPASSVLGSSNRADPGPGGIGPSPPVPDHRDIGAAPTSHFFLCKNDEASSQPQGRVYPVACPAPVAFAARRDEFGRGPPAHRAGAARRKRAFVAGAAGRRANMSAVHKSIMKSGLWALRRAIQIATARFRSEKRSSTLRPRKAGPNGPWEERRHYLTMGSAGAGRASAKYHVHRTNRTGDPYSGGPCHIERGTRNE